MYSPNKENNSPSISSPEPKTIGMKHKPVKETKSRKVQCAFKPNLLATRFKMENCFIFAKIRIMSSCTDFGYE